MPAAVRALFAAERLDRVQRFAGLLATEGVVRGLIGPREVPRLWERHIVNCALLATALPRDATVADVGSGAGLPGLVVAIARPDLRITLIEPLLRRTTFLEEAVESLGLDNVVVRRDRADALHGEQTFDVVTARAVAPLERLLGWCMPLVSPEGALIAMKGTSAEQELVAARPVLRKLGCAEPSIEIVPAAGSEAAGVTAAGEHDPSATSSPPQTRLVRVTWSDPARVSLPTSGGRGGSRAGRRRTPHRKKRSA